MSRKLLSNSLLVLLTTALMAGAGALFWVIAARLATPEEIGLAGSLVAAGDALALFAQLGLNIAIVRALPASTRQAGDVTTAAVVVLGAGATFGLGYAVLLPLTAPQLAEVLASPLVIAAFSLLVAATALNVLTDSVFLALDRARWFLRLNGVYLGLIKLSLPFLLAGAGAIGLYFSVGIAVACCAVASLWLVLRHLPAPRRPAPSPQLLANRGFAAAGYVSYVLAVLPLLVLPLVVINALGSRAAGTYFIAFQVAMLLNAGLLAVANATYAECERARHARHTVAARGGMLLVGGAVVGCVAMVAVAPHLLGIFGSHYSAEGTATLRVLALACVGAALNYWGIMRLRLAANLAAMVGVQLVSTVVVLGLALAVADRGTVWVAAAWGIGHAVGGLLSYLLTTTLVRFDDDAPAITDEARSPA